MTNVRTESRTIRVVAESRLVTLTPAKLKNAILKWKYTLTAVISILKG